jgi:signal transduction histidine kinase
MRIASGPRGLVGQIILVLLGALLLEFLASTMLYEQTETWFTEAEHTERLAERLVVAARVLSLEPPAARAAAARALSTAGARIEWREQQLPDAGRETAASAAMLGRLVAAEPELSEHGLWITMKAGDTLELAGALRLADGSGLVFTAPTPGGPSLVYARVLTGLVLAGSVLLAAAMLVRALGAPIRLLARAADRIGHGPAVAVPEDGPGEVRHLARAFNAMQGRIAALVADRTTALAAVSHDLHTPTARCRLRAGFLTDEETRRKIEEDLDEMEAMIGSVLAFLRSEDDPEEQRQVDLAALLRTVVDAAADAGQPARYNGPDRAVVAVRRLAMKRAFTNLVGNALVYGGDTCVSLERDGARVMVRVEDNGPGIPDSEIGRVMEPFQRLETARSCGVGGAGLGLSIAQQAVKREGGRLTLRNRAAGGLCAEVTLPMAP